MRTRSTGVLGNGELSDNDGASKAVFSRKLLAPTCVPAAAAAPPPAYACSSTLSCMRHPCVTHKATIAAGAAVAVDQTLYIPEQDGAANNSEQYMQHARRPPGVRHGRARGELRASAR